MAVLRTWTARATEEGAAGYARHFDTVVRHELDRLPGFRGATLMRREADGAVEIVVQTRWASRAAIAAFAGDDIGHAVVEPGARAVLLAFDERAAHHDILAEIGASEDPQGGSPE